MRQRVLITGGSGLLALSWALAMRDRFTVVLGLHRRIIMLDGVECLVLSLESLDQLKRKLEIAQPDIVVNAVGLTNVERCEAEPELARHVNIELPEIVAKSCASLGLPLVHISTDHLFSGIDSFVAELQPVAPINTYARTKAPAEVRVLRACPEALVIRTNFFGWGPSYRHSFSDGIINGLRAGKEIILFHDVYYTPILAEFLALTVHDLIDRRAKGVFNVVGDERISKYEFGIRLAGQFGLDESLINKGKISARASLVRRPHDMSLSNEKVCTLLGRKLGSVNEHIARLWQQEALGLNREIKDL